MLNVEITSALVENPYERQGDVVRFYESSYPGLVSIYAPGRGARLTRESVETLRDALSAYLEETDPTRKVALPDVTPYAIGSRAVVLGDSKGWSHNLAAGTVVEITEDDVRIDGSYEVATESGATAWVGHEDLSPVEEPEVDPRTVEGTLLRLRDGVTMSAKPGSIARVVGPHANAAMVAIEWIGGPFGGQMDGGYFVEKFEVVEDVWAPGFAPGDRVEVLKDRPSGAGLEKGEVVTIAEVVPGRDGEGYYLTTGRGWAVKEEDLARVETLAPWKPTFRAGDRVQIGSSPAVGPDGGYVDPVFAGRIGTIKARGSYVLDFDNGVHLEVAEVQADGVRYCQTVNVADLSPVEPECHFCGGPCSLRW